MDMEIVEDKFNWWWNNKNVKKLKSIHFNFKELKLQIVT